MEKIVRCRICPEDAGLTVEKAALLRLGLTRHQLRSAKFRADGIRLNGVGVRTSVMVAPGDLLEICLEADMPVGDSANAAASTVGPAVSAAAPASSAFPLLSILYEDEDLLILDKPAGMVSHPGRGHRGDSLTDLVLAYFRAQGRSLCPGWSGGWIRIPPAAFSLRKMRPQRSASPVPVWCRKSILPSHRGSSQKRS